MSNDRKYIIIRTFMWEVCCGMGAVVLWNDKPGASVVCGLMGCLFLWQGYRWWRITP